jgi:hypothetical protein
MGTLVEQGIIAESRMLVNNMIKEGLELCPDDSPLTIEGGRGTPMEVSFAWLYPLGCASQSFILAIFDRTFRISVKRHDK